MSSSNGSYPSERRLKFQMYACEPLFALGVFIGMFCAFAWLFHTAYPLVNTTQMYVGLWLTPLPITMVVASYMFRSSAEDLYKLYHTVVQGKVTQVDDGTRLKTFVTVEGPSVAGGVTTQRIQVSPAEWSRLNLDDVYPWKH